MLEQAPFERLTPRTLTTAEELTADADETRERGYSRSDQDVTEGISALGVAVLDPRGNLTGALSIGGLARDFDQNRTRFVDVLHETAQRLAVNLGA